MRTMVLHYGWYARCTRLHLDAFGCIWLQLLWARDLPHCIKPITVASAAAATSVHFSSRSSRCPCSPDRLAYGRTRSSNFTDLKLLHAHLTPINHLKPACLSSSRHSQPHSSILPLPRCCQPFVPTSRPRRCHFALPSHHFPFCMLCLRGYGPATADALV